VMTHIIDARDGDGVIYFVFLSSFFVLKLSVLFRVGAF